MGWEAAAMIGSTAIDWVQTNRTNQRRIALAREQMRFQERMSSTAYSRAMADMRKGGLNPILAGQVGGASTPPGAMPPQETPRVGSTAKDAIRIAQELQLLKNQVKTEQARADLITAQAQALGGPAAAGGILGEGIKTIKDRVSTDKEFGGMLERLLLDRAGRLGTSTAKAMQREKLERARRARKKHTRPKENKGPPKSKRNKKSKDYKAPARSKWIKLKET